MWPFGVVASTVANFSMGAPKKPLQPADFGLGVRSKKSGAVRIVATEEEQINNLRAWGRRAENVVKAAILKE